MKLNLRASLLIPLSIMIGGGINARTFIPAMLDGAIPAEFRTFVDRYLTAALDDGRDSAEKVARRMSFDEVTTSFPVTEEGTTELAEANGLTFTLNSGKRYSIGWIKDSVLIAEMSFPASYNLIHGTTQPESFSKLADQLRDNIRVTADARKTSAPDSATIVCREGREFYLGHLDNDIWIDAVDARPVWTPKFPSESITNLFCVDNMPDVAVDLQMVNYDMQTTAIATSAASLRYILGTDEECAVYSGIESVGDDGTITALVVFHNPAFAYLHKLDVTVDSARLFTTPVDSGKPAISAVLHPYIKLHNLTDLWGEKNRQK